MVGFAQLVDPPVLGSVVHARFVQFVADTRDDIGIAQTVGAEQTQWGGVVSPTFGFESRIPGHE